MTTNTYSYKELEENFSLLLENFDNLLKTSGNSLNLKATKLFSYKNKLQQLDKLNDQEISNLIKLITKYISINVIFNDSGKIKFDPKKLIELISGTHALDDTTDAYNGSFFEFSMAIRFALTVTDSKSIDLRGICDVVIDNDLGLECKYVTSQSKVYKNISEAIKQLELRLTNKEINYGLAAIDFSCILEEDRIFNFIKVLFKQYIRNHLRISYNYDAALNSVMGDKNFINAIHAYLMHEMEILFHEKFLAQWKRSNKTINPKIIAITYQYNISILLEHGNIAQPLVIRNLTYFVNKNSNQNDIDSAVGIIKGLGHGI